jgi:glycosyltransferase involved in cell wall biosynthesis
MAAKLGQRVGAEMVSLVPIGVSATAAHCDDEDEDEDDDERVLTLVVLGESRDMAAYRAMLEGLSRVARERVGMQVIMELHGPHEHEIWRHVRRLDLLGAVSSIADFGNYRSLLAGCDIMLVPERFGDLRSVILEGMGQSAAPIVSAESPLDVFVSNETAVFVRHAEADDWAHAVLKLAGDAAERQRLGEAARQVILARHRSSDQVAGLIVTLERVLRGGAIPFTGENARALSGMS